MSKRWFRAKTYGFGWTPVSWEGWVAIGLFAVFELWNFLRLDEYSHSVSDTLRPFVIESVLAAFVLACISYWKGEPPRWRWGK